MQPAEQSQPSIDKSKLIHHNAILGCESWARWSELQFEKSKLLTWYRSPVKDILFNSVLDCDLSEKIFPEAIRQVTQHCSKQNVPVAWLIPEPGLLTTFHRNLFAEMNYQECPGTTGMWLDLKDTSLQPLFLPKQPLNGDGALEIETVSSEAQLDTWARILIESYQFPKSITEAWIALHQEIGYRVSHNNEDSSQNDLVWEHLLIRSNGEYVGTSSLFHGGGVENASFANLAVVQSERGSGIGSKIVRESLKRLLEGGYKTVTLYASQDAYGLYSRLGFQPSTRNTFFVRSYSS